MFKILTIRLKVLKIGCINIAWVGGKMLLMKLIEQALESIAYFL
jgi:hypothetical protein